MKYVLVSPLSSVRRVHLITPTPLKSVSSPHVVQWLCTASHAVKSPGLC
jgi:hypothetical protein